MLKAWKNVYQRKADGFQHKERPNTEKYIIKDGILEDIGRTVKLFGTKNAIVTSECWIIVDLCQHLDEAFRHGLRQPSAGYWPFVRNFTHANNIGFLENVTEKKNTFEKGCAWLNHSLNEGSLESYLQAFSCENVALRKYYIRDSLLRDISRRSMLLSLLASLRDIHFELTLHLSEADKSRVTSLSSPEDSGVALLDSDLSEPLDSLQDDQEDDDTTLNELEDNRINRLLLLELDTSGKCIEPCIAELSAENEKLIMEKSEKVILRTPKKNILENNRHLKRVSFHEECFSQTDFSVSFVAPGSAVLKKDTVRGRYSWCAGGDTPFLVCDTEPKTSSMFVLPSECAEERGVPEGQEDNQIYAERPAQKKVDVLKLKRKQLLEKREPKCSLYWPSLKPNPQACQQILEELEHELGCFKKRELDISPFSETTLHTLKKIFFNSIETVYKVFKAYGPLLQPHICPVLVLLTNNALYVIGSNSESYKCHYAVQYKNFPCLLLGPSGQTLYFASIDKECIMLAMDKTEETCNLLCHIELAHRKQNLMLPLWKCLGLEDMKCLWHSLAQKIPSLQGERLLYFCLVHIQDEIKSLFLQSPSKEGLLMMRIGRSGPWAPAFLGLRESELWIYVDEVEREPQLVLSLVRCQGCHRSVQTERPHTFEIVCGKGSAPLQLAAADEYEASEWLQALIQAASGPIRNQTLTTNSLRLNGLVLSSGHLVTYRLEKEVPEPICCAAISHLTALRFVNPSSNWCVLEFECSEAYENSGDWILYFSSSADRARFCSQLEAVWSTFSQMLFPSTCVVQECLLNHCKETSLGLQTAWDRLLSLDCRGP